MRVHAAVALALAALAGGWTSIALGQVSGVTVPTVTVPPVPSVPTVPVPLPLPDVTAPSTETATGTATETATESATGSAAETVDATGTAVGGVTGQGSGSAEGREGARQQERAQPSRRDPDLRAYPRRFKNRPERGEPFGTTLSFWIGTEARVTFSIRRVAPDCVFIGTFRYQAHRGVNRVRWFGHYAGRRLPPGTYRITAIARRGTESRSIGTVRVVIAPRSRDSEDVDPQPSACRAYALAAQSRRGTTGAGGATVAGADLSGDPDEDAQEDVAGTAASSEPPTSGVNVAGPFRDGRILGVLPNPFEDAPSWLQPLLLGALAAAILLLLLAAVPAPALRPVDAAAVVAGRRTDLALAGALILAAVAVAALLL
jgi:hypothetical protein